MKKGFDPGILESDIEALFRVGSKFVLEIPGKGAVEIFMRVPSEEDINNARVYALRESSETRRKVFEGGGEDLGIDLDMSILNDVQKLSKEDIVNLIIQNNMDRLISEARKNIQVPFPKEPDSDAGLEEWEQYQKQVDEWPDKFKEALKRELDAIIERERNALSKKDKDALVEMIRNSIINKFIEVVNLNRFLDYLLYRIVFKSEDMKERVFSGPEQVRDLPIIIRNQLKDFYELLVLDTGTLKK